jgi:GNAT superfamily N-acetyltransferase
MDFFIEGPQFNSTALCTPILRCLPDWFGIEDALTGYASEIDHLPTFLARNSEKVIGFLSLKLHNPYSAEVYVMGVMPDAHRRGIGKALMEEAQNWLRTQKIEFVQVKTLAPSRSDAGYAATREFYSAMGFRPLEELKQIWNEDNPCLILVKKL